MTLTCQCGAVLTAADEAALRATVAAARWSRDGKTATCRRCVDLKDKQKTEAGA
jgi:hypothetical protein